MWDGPGGTPVETRPPTGEPVAVEGFTLRAHTPAQRDLRDDLRRDAARFRRLEAGGSAALHDDGRAATPRGRPGTAPQFCLCGAISRSDIPLGKLAAA